MPTLEKLRTRVLRSSLFAPCSLEKAVEKLGFVQADPIRSPARAQDLVLRHRVKKYRAGNLEQSYPKLGLEECFLFAYGFLSKDLWRVIHPSSKTPFSKAEKKALECVARHGPMYPKDLETYLGGERVRNYWGGFSRSAKMVMEELHDRGALRVARRENGIRIYETAEEFEQKLSKEERFERLILAALKSMGATTRKFLLSELRFFDHLAENLGERRKRLQRLIDDGRVRVEVVDSVEYVSLNTGNSKRSQPDAVYVLAPFDPVVRDRSRFEHLWGWTYRFEAYTPKAKRKLGYYAMPVLWRDHVVGWVNAKVEEGRLKAEFGYVTSRPREKAYKAAAEKEIASMAVFLGLGESDWQAVV